ncbi:MAG TPA: hypothetical protein VNC18_15270 [Gemmatimonadaceae bacterium]|jgi:hypothetical protein|nr:hypothetical protein [Gemmatimonadaceae bacterium]
MAARTKSERKPQPQIAMVKMYEVTIDGQKKRLTEAEYQAQFERAKKNLILKFNLIQSEASSNRQDHKKWMDEVHGKHWYSVGTISDIVGDALPPPDSIWTRPNAAVTNGLRAANEGKLEVAARQLKLANDTLREVKHEWNSYLQKTISGAESTQGALEITRDVSFAIALSAAAIVAAPVVAGAAGTAFAGAGLTGAGLTAATTATTAVAITAGGGVAGGVLRGGSNLAGQAVAGGPISMKQLKKETWEGVKHGAVDAGSTFVGGAAGELLGAGAKGISLTSRVIRGAGAGIAGGGFGGGLGATLEGKSAGEIVDDTLTGAASGLVGGGIGSGVSHVIPNAPKLVQSVAGATVGSGVAAGQAYLSGASPEEIKKAAVVAGIQGFATSQAGHEGGFGLGEGGAELQQRTQNQRAALAAQPPAIREAQPQTHQQEPQSPVEQSVPHQQDATPQQATPQVQDQVAPEQLHAPNEMQQTPVLEQSQQSGVEETPQSQQQSAPAPEPVQQTEAQPASKQDSQPSPKEEAPQVQSKSEDAKSQSAPEPASPQSVAAEKAAKTTPKVEDRSENFFPDRAEIEQHVENMFGPMEGKQDVPTGVDSSKVKGRKIEDIRVKKGKVNATGEVERPGPRKADMEDIQRLPNETGRQAVARVNKVISKAISETPLAAAWEQARAKVLGGQTVESLGRQGTLDAYKSAQKEFWKAVRADPAAVQFLQDSGFTLPPGEGAALLNVNPPKAGQQPLAVEERRISLDHSVEKAIGQNWKKALDGDNLVFEFHRNNSYRDSTQRALKIGAYAPKTP